MFIATTGDKILKSANGKLKYFITSGNNEYYDVDGVVEFWTDNGAKWTFKNRLLTDVNDNINSRYYYCDYFGNFTYIPYYMEFDCGYLKSYRNTDEEDIILTDIYNTNLPYEKRGWTYGDYVYYYKNVEDTKNDDYFTAKYIEKLYFSVKREKGYAIGNLSYKERGYYARIGDCYFYCDGNNGYRMVEIV